MKKNVIFLFILSSLLLAGCGKGDYNTDHDEDSSSLDEFSDNSVLTGEITEINNNAFHLDVNEAGQNIADTIWVTVEDADTMSEIQIGQHVSIWFDMIRESYPPQTDALKIEIH